MTRTSNSKHLVKLCILTVAALVVVACGPDTNGNNGGGGSITPDQAEDELLTLYGDAVCTSFFQCPEEQNPNSVLAASRYETEEDCSENILSAFGGAGISPLARDAEAGLTDWDGAKGRECINDFEELLSDPCSSPFSANLTPPESCDEAIQGTQPNGAACDSSDHCQSGYCDTNVDTGDVCWGGECAEMPETDTLAEGADCSMGGECDPEQNLVCDSDASGEGSVCVLRDSRTEGDSCRATIVCESGLACLEGTCTSLPLGAQGDACDLQNTFCQPGLICKVNSVSQQGVDGVCAAPLDQGAECYLDISCKDGFHCAGADIVSDTTGTCDTPLPAGEACDSDFDCQEGLTCNFEEVCEAQEEEPYCEVPTEMMGS